MRSSIDAISTPDGQPVDNFVAHWGFGDSRGKVLTVSVICMAIVIVLSAVFAFAYGTQQARSSVLHIDHSSTPVAPQALRS